MAEVLDNNVISLTDSAIQFSTVTFSNLQGNASSSFMSLVNSTADINGLKITDSVILAPLFNCQGCPTISIRNSAIQGNSASQSLMKFSGDIQVQSTLTIENSSFISNDVEYYFQSIIILALHLVQVDSFYYVVPQDILVQNNNVGNHTLTAKMAAFSLTNNIIRNISNFKTISSTSVSGVIALEILGSV